MYNPDIFIGASILKDSPEIEASPDRQKFLNEVVDHIANKYGVTRTGDRLYVRTSEHQIEFLVLEVKLKRDYEREELANQPDYK